MSLPCALIVDLDGTLCDHKHRLHFVERDHHWQPKEEGSEELIRCTPPGWKPDYEKFYSGIPGDSVNEWCRSLLNQMAQNAHHQMIHQEYGGGCKILFVTGRPEKYRKPSEKQIIGWLEEPNTVCDWGIEWELFMRPDFLRGCDNPKGGWCSLCDLGMCHEKPDHRPSHEVKREIYKRDIKGKYDVLFCLDDDERCCQAYRDLGLTVLKVIR